MGKGEIARYEQFLLFPQCFQKACFPGVAKDVIVWEWVNPFPNNEIIDSSKLKEFPDDNLQFDKNRRKFLRKGRNHCRKRRNCSLQEISPNFPQCFQTPYTADT